MSATTDSYDATSEVDKAQAYSSSQPVDYDYDIDHPDARARRRQYELFSQTGKNPTIDQLIDRYTD